MSGQHLVRRGARWYYQRRRPREFANVEPNAIISFSLKTTDHTEARLRAAEISIDLDRKWHEAKERGVSLKSQDAALRYAAAVATAHDAKISYQPAAELSDDDLLQRLRMLIIGAQPTEEQKAVLGLIKEPKLAFSQAFDRFWEHIKDEWMRLSRDQQRVKRNIYLKAIRNFEAHVGEIALYDVKREHALAFRSWWMERVEKKGLKPYTANREINSLRRLFSVNFDMDAHGGVNPFHRVRLKDTKEQTRQPFSSDFIQTVLLALGALDGLKPELRILVHLLINTGARPSEAIGLELADVDISADIPFIHIRANGTRSLKTDHSERQIPLVGVSLDAAKELVDRGGWGKWQGKNMYATSVVNKHLRNSGIITDKRQSLYSLRHWFQDQLTKNDVVDRAQAQLMGHKFQRPKYGFGKDLTELREIIEKFAL